MFHFGSKKDTFNFKKQMLYNRFPSFSHCASQGGERGGAGGTKYRGPSYFEGPVTGFEWPRSRKTFFLKNTRNEMLEKLFLRFVKTFL